ncbi:hypothetical protein DM02DRAFT_63953 [Periconia macrospinosa]|uniref:RRM domain-containing protein n=1 Tax=Periconia macrospinosa TaxID=97972 RepID=A0A2V1DIH0_9PLEO|nr:hypothetical protein DM02DRAFT_63953 [Periconia macrospinosa]
MAASNTSKSGDYLLVASGQTAYAPYLVGWQEFKDHIRKVVKEQPGWTHVTHAQGQRKGEMQGWCRLRDREDADAVYNCFARSRGILVHVFSTSLRGGQFEMTRCNCMLHFPDVGDRGHSARRSGIDINSVNQTFGGRCSMTIRQTSAVMQTPYTHGSYYQAPAYAPAPAYPYQTYQPAAPQMPTYSQNTSGLPVNLSQGAAITEARGIYIQGLSYQTRDSDLWALICSVGLRPVEAKVQKDARGNSKGAATARFSSKAEAQYGVTALNKTTHMGKTLNVRLDVESTVVGHIDPLVVDGTNKLASLAL